MLDRITRVNSTRPRFLGHYRETMRAWAWWSLYAVYTIEQTSRWLVQLTYNQLVEPAWSCKRGIRHRPICCRSRPASVSICCYSRYIHCKIIIITSHLWCDGVCIRFNFTSADWLCHVFCNMCILRSTEQRLIIQVISGPPKPERDFCSVAGCLN